MEEQMTDFNPNSDPARAELIRILQSCNISQFDRIVLTVDANTDQPMIEIQYLDYPLGRFFRKMCYWKTQREYKANTYERLLLAVKTNPEWLTFDVAFELGSQYQF
jgi:hypothetical protein